MKILGKKTYPPINNQVMFPTPELRYRLGDPIPRMFGEYDTGERVHILQQKWVNPTTGEDTWKDIPTV